MSSCSPYRGELSKQGRFTNRPCSPTPYTWADENQPYLGQICIGEVCHFCSHETSEGHQFSIGHS
jgi:hypothetical protein